jgi:hypothetical protein
MRQDMAVAYFGVPTIPAFTWRGLREIRKKPERIVGVSAEIRTECLPDGKTDASAEQPYCSVYTHATFGFENQKLVFYIQINTHILFHIYCMYVCVAESAYGRDPSFKIQQPGQLTS